jgi:hypothetical protein
MELGRYSFGIGDRFGREGRAQLAAFQKLLDKGISVTPVWNKSSREHQLIGSSPVDTRKAAEAAVKAANWPGAYFLDADHIGRKTVKDFIGHCNYFTVDVAEQIGKPVEPIELAEFLRFCQRFTKPYHLPRFISEKPIDLQFVARLAARYLAAIEEVQEIYQYLTDHIAQSFILELSIDETQSPQTPIELFVILIAAAWKKLPLDTIAPKFSGQFNKGIDYIGELEQFANEFEQDIRITQFAVEEFGFPAGLKLSIHSGSDKFSLYPIMRSIIAKYDTGLHLKTAGTTWLEELIGMAAADGEGLVLAKEIYRQAFARNAELTAPYATVLAIDQSKLPKPAVVAKWSAAEFVAALQHDPQAIAFNPNFRQLLHVGYKIAAEMGSEFQDALARYAEFIAPHVTDNLYSRHLQPLFIG